MRHASVHFFAVVARLRQSHETSIFHAPVLWSSWPQHKKRSFSKHRYGPFGFNLRKVRQYLIKNWNWVTSVKFETVRLSFCCHPEKLLPCQRDVTTSPFRSLLQVLKRDSPELHEPRLFLNCFSVRCSQPVQTATSPSDALKLVLWWWFFCGVLTAPIQHKRGSNLF